MHRTKNQHGFQTNFHFVFLKNTFIYKLIKKKMDQIDAKNYFSQDVWTDSWM